MMRAATLVLVGVALGCAGSPVESGTIANVSQGDGEGDGDTTAATRGSDDGSGAVSAEGSAASDPSDPTDPTDPSGPTDPTDPTDASDPTDPTNASDPTDPSGTTGADGSSTDPTAVESSGSAETNVGPCEEDDESNQDYQESVPLGDLACNGGTLEHSAVIDAATNPDWFYFQGQWVMECGNGDAEPSVTFTDGNGLPFCLLPNCSFGTTEATCTQGDPNGDRCCGTGTVAMALNCSGTDYEDASIDIIIDAPDAACVPFTFTYSY